VATEKLGALHAAGAAVTVVAPAVDDRIAAAAALAPVTIHRRPFVAADLEGTWFVVAAAVPAVNGAVVAAAEAHRVFVLAVDDVAHATAFGAGTIRRGGLTLAVSTEGRAPALAGLLREALDAVIPEEIGEWVETAQALRPAWKRDRVPFPVRRPLLLAALNRLYGARGAAAPAAEAPRPALAGAAIGGAR
jgi:uroporphyrin-III C-methyltransferase/precorrin-2 dehydrogenase/sirohydrochlorin ferrochelatase